MRRIPIVNLVAIAAGAAIAGAGINALNIANGLAEGGVTGIAVLIKLTMGWDPGLVSFLQARVGLVQVASDLNVVTALKVRKGLKGVVDGALLFRRSFSDWSLLHLWCGFSFWCFRQVF